MNLHMIIAVASATLLSSALASPAWTADPGTTPVPEAGTNTADFDVQEIVEGLKSGDEASTLQEEAAVDDYLDTLPDDAVLTKPEDLQVGTIEMSEGLQMTIVNPADATPDSIQVTADVKSGEVSAGADWAISDAVGTSTGPGMAARWQSWDDVPLYRLVIRLYVDHGDWNDYIGRAEFHTSTRKLLNDGDVRTRWQVRRWAQAVPQKWEKGPDLDMRVQKLWMSNEPINKPRGWVTEGQGGTSPTSNKKVCENQGSFSVAAGPASFSIPVDNCEDWDVWRGPGDTDAGHYRMAFDQGTWAQGGPREMGYASGYEMKHGVSGVSTFYEFVTLRIGSQSTKDFKCKSEKRGTTGTNAESCWWGADAYTNNPDKWAK